MDYHYTWEWAQYFEPVVGWLHRLGYFSFYVHFPVDSLLGTILFVWVYRRLRRHTLLDAPTTRWRFVWYALYYSVSWLALTSLGVGLKTMIVEELDYQERQWFEPYLGPGHLYISSACVAYLALILKSKHSYSDLLLAAYVQVALMAGYVVSVYRMLGEDIEGASGGALLFVFFLACNYDLVKRVRRSFLADTPVRTRVHA